MRVALVAIVLLAGCRTPRDAIVRGKRVERPTFGYSDGELFAVEHRRAYPDVFAGNRPYYVDDGELGGRACGLDLQFFSEWYGHMMTLYGRGSTPMPWLTQDVRGGVAVTLTIDELGPGHLHIRGSTAGILPFPIDIDVSADRLVAQIGTRHVDLYPVGHWLVGPLVQHDDASSIEARFAIYGREVLRTMVPADEALILLMMITCNGSIEYGGRPERGFSLVSSPEAQIGVVPETKSTVIRGVINPRGWSPPPTPR